MKRRTVVVEGPLAFRTRRIDAARRAEGGLQILTLPQLAARLAGGFARPAQSQDLDGAIRKALADGGFRELDGIRDLPGTTRAMSATLVRLWNADFPLQARAGDGARLADVATIEARVRANLPPAVLSPPDLRDAAMQRLANAPAVLGPVELLRVVRVAPVWRPLLEGLARTGSLAWTDPGAADTSWFPGELISKPPSAAPAPQVVSCATPRAETIEALRWMRELISSGRARPEEIAISATSTGEWDAHMLVLASDLPLHFSHGLPALASREGQACAALCDLLLNGLSQARVRRLVGHAARRSRGLADLPADWARGLQWDAALFELDQWKRALDAAHAERTDGVDVRTHVMPVLELLAAGPASAEEAGRLLLSDAARPLWSEALRRAPADALEFTLQEIRMPDGSDPSACAAWCPADQLAAAPRRFVRLLGLTSRSWPRRSGEDSLIPSHILPREKLGFPSVTEQDRHAFRIISENADGELVLSRSVRNAQGGLQAASPLIPNGAETTVLKRGRLPPHAFSETDRLLARPAEAATIPALASAAACWRDWNDGTVTAHDGRTTADHPVVAHAVARPQSATSLRLMLRDPLAFVWRYALGWRPLADDEQPLSLDARAFGELVHEILKRAVDALEPHPGYARAARHEIEKSLDGAVDAVAARWPLTRSVPPVLLWRHTLAAARDLASRALTLDEEFQPDTRSWTELAFGQEGVGADSPRDPPWPATAEVVIPGTGVRIRGSIDRLDFNVARNAIRVSDYKTGAEPPRPEQIVLGRGAELQRVLYALAARQLVADDPRIIARLVYLRGERPRPHRLPDIEQAVADVARYVSAAVELLRRGVLLPGPDSREDWNDFKLALPAAAQANYFPIKQGAMGRAFGDFSRVWSAR